jgi:hypothetical protein
MALSEFPDHQFLRMISIYLLAKSHATFDQPIANKPMHQTAYGGR